MFLSDPPKHQVMTSTFTTSWPLMGEHLGCLPPLGKQYIRSSIHTGRNNFQTEEFFDPKRLFRRLDETKRWSWDQETKSQVGAKSTLLPLYFAPKLLHWCFERYPLYQKRHLSFTAIFPPFSYGRGIEFFSFCFQLDTKFRWIGAVSREGGKTWGRNKSFCNPPIAVAHRKEKKSTYHSLKPTLHYTTLLFPLFKHPTPQMYIYLPLPLLRE